MAKEGYFGDSDEFLAVVAPSIGETVKRVHELGLPPVFVWIYDAPWRCYQRLAPVISHFIGEDYKVLPDFWTWHVDPQRNQTGWGPHRDKSRMCLTPAGKPLSLTCWIPLSEATPLNGCMYIVPAHLDPAYNKPSYNGPPFSAYAVRALPAVPGDYFIWNQAVLHWGGPTSEFAESPRMSMALEFQRGDVAPYNQPLLDPATLPSFAWRLRLIGKQILQYRHMYGYSEALTALATHLQQAQLPD